MRIMKIAYCRKMRATKSTPIAAMTDANNVKIIQNLNPKSPRGNAKVSLLTAKKARIPQIAAAVSGQFEVASWEFSLDRNLSAAARQQMTRTITKKLYTRNIFPTAEGIAASSRIW